MTSLTIAIDGPAASGKGTLARRLAAHFGIPHLDTGLTYRAVGHHLWAHNLPMEDEQAALDAARSIDLSALDRDALSQHHIGNAASKVAVMPAVRQALVEAQRAFAQTSAGAVLDGRDIGTVVLPKADVKLNVVASPTERATRRYDEIQKRGGDASMEAILHDLEERDRRDSEREDSPLRAAEDAVLIDTSELDIEQAFAVALDAVEAKIGKR